MFTVYVLRSVTYPERLYIGMTADLESRLLAHNNSADSHYTSKYRPWALEASIAVKDKETATKLERYLKSGSGFAFLKKRLLP